MSGDIHQNRNQERIEDYLELESYIEELQAGRVAYPSTILTPTQTCVYHMVELFHSVSSAGAEPRADFISALQARLEQELQ